MFHKYLLQALENTSKVEFQKKGKTSILKTWHKDLCLTNRTKVQKIDTKENIIQGSLIRPRYITLSCI